jgi:hypothetical protein
MARLGFDVSVCRTYRRSEDPAACSGIEEDRRSVLSISVRCKEVDDDTGNVLR